MVVHKKDAEWADLMVKAQQGNEACYRKLLLEITPFIRAVLSKKIGAHDWLEDVVQEALVAIHRGRNTYDPHRPFNSWMLAIVHYKMTDGLRKHYRKGAHEHTDSESIVTFTEDGTKTESERLEDTQSLEKMLAALQPREQRILVWAKMHGHSMKEIADHENMSVSAVKVAIHRAVKELRLRFGKAE
mgnify:CR=1 FL=1